MQNGQSSPNNAAALAAAQQQYEQASAKEAKMVSLYKIGRHCPQAVRSGFRRKISGTGSFKRPHKTAGSLVKASPEAIAQKQEELKTLKKKYKRPYAKAAGTGNRKPPAPALLKKNTIMRAKLLLPEKKSSASAIWKNCSVNIKISAQAAQNLKPGQKNNRPCPRLKQKPLTAALPK